MKKKTAMFVGAGVLFVAANIFLTVHTESKVSRTSFITDWFEAKTETLQQTLHTAGVLTPDEEYPVYYNPEQGGFEQFLVEKGDQVTEGTSLYEYSSARVDEDRQRLQSEKDSLSQEMDLLDDQIAQLEYLQRVYKRSADSSIEGVLTSDVLMDTAIEKEIYDKEQDQEELKKEIDDIEDQIDALDEGREIDFSSVVSGTVKDINYDLQNPIMTIISETPKVSGTFTEKELAQVEPGMEVCIESDLIGKKVRGTLVKIANHPEGEPRVGEESQFTYEVELDQEGMVPDGNGSFVWEETDEAESEDDVDAESQDAEADMDAESKAPAGKIVHGTQVNVTIVTSKVADAVTVSNEQVEKGSYLYVLTKTGTIERRQIQLGLEVDKQVEIIDGLEAGETVVARPKQVARAEEPFITKLEPQNLRIKSIKAERKMDLIKGIGVGFSKR